MVAPWRENDLGVAGMSGWALGGLAAEGVSFTATSPVDAKHQTIQTTANAQKTNPIAGFQEPALFG